MRTTWQTWAHRFYRFRHGLIDVGKFDGMDGAANLHRLPNHRDIGRSIDPIQRGLQQFLPEIPVILVFSLQVSLLSHPFNLEGHFYGTVTPIPGQVTCLDQPAVQTDRERGIQPGQVYKVQLGKAFFQLKQIGSNVLAKAQHDCTVVVIADILKA
ncbi:hypothetical protein D3C71_1386000 [compost metagenome]